MASITTREALLAAAAASRLPRESVDVPELGGAVIIQGMSGKQRDQWERSLVVMRRGVRKDIDLKNVRARLLVRCIVNEAGVRLLEDNDADAIGELRVDVVNRLYEIAQRLSGVSDGDADELEKASAPGDGSATPTN